MLPLTSTGQTPCIYNGAEILKTRHGTIYVCARWLLAEGLAEPEDRIETFWAGTTSMAGLIGECAEWMVSEGTSTARFWPGTIRSVQRHVQRLWKACPRDLATPIAANLKIAALSATIARQPASQEQTWLSKPQMSCRI